MKTQSYTMRRYVTLEAGALAGIEATLVVDFDLIPADPSVGLNADVVEIWRVRCDFGLGNILETNYYDDEELEPFCHEFVASQKENQE